jgi:hypothetical protein
MAAGIAAVAVPDWAKAAKASPSAPPTSVNPPATGRNLDFYRPDIDGLPDDVLGTLCGDDYAEFGKLGNAINVVRDYQEWRLKESVLSQIVGRRVLGDNYPIFGREENGLLTARPVGFRWKSGEGRRRVTIPTFEIVCTPQVPGKVFAERDFAFLRTVLDEAVAAIGLCELEYFRALCEAVSVSDQQVYDTEKFKGTLTPEFLLGQMERMHKNGIVPAAIFMRADDMFQLRRSGARGIDWEPDCNRSAETIMKAPVAGRLGGALLIDLDTPQGRYATFFATDSKKAVHIYGRPEDPSYATAQFVYDGFKVRFRHEHKSTPGGPYSQGPDWTYPALLKHEQRVGFLLGSPAGVLTIDRSGSNGVTLCRHPNRIKAWVVGEEGGDVISVL